MENKTVGHTPGPWRVRMAEADKIHSGDIAVYGHSKTNMGRCVARVYGEGWLSSRMDERDANARLIAAAPELLAGAKELEHYASRLPVESVTVGLIDCLARIRDAIAKAEGR